MIRAATIALFLGALAPLIGWACSDARLMVEASVEKGKW